MLQARRAAAAQLRSLLLRQGACSWQQQHRLIRQGASSLPDTSHSNTVSTSSSGGIGSTLCRHFASGLSNVISIEAGKTRLQGYFPGGFIVNNTQVEGAILCLPDTWLMWDVNSLTDVTADSLAILDVAAPAPEVLVLGCGSTMQRLPGEVMQHLAARGVALELLDTRNAISTFNFLNDEGRVVVGALLPMGEVPEPHGSSSDSDNGR